MHGSNIVVSAPNATHVTERLAALDLLVVADVVMSETAAMADVVLPVTQWAEETGTMTNLEGRVVLRQQAVAPPDGRAQRPRRDRRAGRAAGLDGGLPDRPRGGLRRAGPRLGRRHGRLRRHHLRPDPRRARRLLALPDAASTRARRGCSPTRFPTPDGRARFVAVDHAGAAEQPDDDYPLHLTTGRVLAQYQSGAQTRRIADLPDDGPFVELHPLLASRIGARDGEPVVVTTRRGELKAPCRVVTTIRPDTVFVPVPLGRRQPAHPRRPRPVEPDAGVQGLRRGGAG